MGKELADRDESCCDANALEVASRVPLSPAREVCVVKALGEVIVLEEGAENLLAAGGVWEVNEDAVAEPAEDGIVEVHGPVCGGEDEHALCLACAEAVPCGHDLVLHLAVSLVLAFVALSKDPVDLINEDDGGRNLRGKRKHGARVLLGLSEPFARHIRSGNRQKVRPALCGDCPCKHSLPSPRRAEQQDALGGLGEVPAAEELRPLQRQHHRLPQHFLHVIERPDVIERHIDLLGGRHIVQQLPLERVGLDVRQPRAHLCWQLALRHLQAPQQALHRHPHTLPRLRLPVLQAVANGVPDSLA